MSLDIRFFLLYFVNRNNVNPFVLAVKCLVDRLLIKLLEDFFF